MNRICSVLFGAAVLALMCGQASADGYFAHINIDNVYDDWAGIPVLAVDPADALEGGPDIATVQVANDNTYLYLRITYHSALSNATYLAIDNDNDFNTGFPVAGLIGSEAGYAGDFDFDQRAGFNIGTLKDPVRLTEPESGSALLAPYEDSLSREMAIRLDTTFDPNVGPGDVFPSDSFTLMFYSLHPVNFGTTDTAPLIPYTLAVPEPTSLLLAALGLAAVVSRRSRAFC